MCGKENGELLVAPAISSAAPVRKGKGKGKARVRSGHRGVAAGKHKLSLWTGLRFRHPGKWATEIRMPRTRDKVWIGTFASPRQAALAYDAAVFCLFGERPPKARKINFPAAPRPEISESERLKLSVADVKAISEKHALKVDALLPPLVDEGSTAALAGNLMVAPATPVPVDAPPHSLYDDDELDQMIRDFDKDAFEAELDATSFIVPDNEYTEIYA